MKIAVTYDNGEIFQHFGKTESFKVYEVEDNKVVSSEVIGSNGTGHGALAGLLAEQGVNVLICGGIGGGAQTALTEAGIELCAGAQGNTDCFVVQGTTQDESGEAVYLLSRAAAQRACREQYLDQLENGSVIPCTVTHIENFGAFCDVGCGISALLPIDCLSVSRDRKSVV